MSADSAALTSKAGLASDPSLTLGDLVDRYTASPFELVAHMPDGTPLFATTKFPKLYLYFSADASESMWAITDADPRVLLAGSKPTILASSKSTASTRPDQAGAEYESFAWGGQWAPDAGMADAAWAAGELQLTCSSSALCGTVLESPGSVDTPTVYGTADDNHNVYALTLGFTKAADNTVCNSGFTKGAAESAHECGRLCAGTEGCAVFSYGDAGTGTDECRFSKSSTACSTAVFPTDGCATYTLDSRYVCQAGVRQVDIVGTTAAACVSGIDATTVAGGQCWIRPSVGACCSSVGDCNNEGLGIEGVLDTTATTCLAPGTEAGSRSLWSSDLYVRGADYPLMNVASAVACQEQCDALPDCAALFYDADAQKCYLRPTVSPRNGAGFNPTEGASPPSSLLYCASPTAELFEEPQADKTCTSHVLDYSRLVAVSSTHFEHGDVNDEGVVSGFTCGGIMECGELGKICGGSSGSKTITKEFGVDPGSTYELTLDLIAVDSWEEGEYAEVLLDDGTPDKAPVQCWKHEMASTTKGNSPVAKHICSLGGDDKSKELVTEVRCRVTATTSMLSLTVTSNINSAGNAASIAVDNVVLSKEFDDAASVSLLDCKQRCRWTDSCAHYDYMATDRGGKGACQLFGGTCMNRATKTGAALYSLHSAEVAPLRGAFSITNANDRVVAAYVTPRGQFVANDDPTVDLSEVPMTPDGETVPNVRIGNALIEFRRKWRLGTTFQKKVSGESCSDANTVQMYSNKPVVECAQHCDASNACAAFSLDGEEKYCSLCNAAMETVADNAEGHTVYESVLTISHVSGRTGLILTNAGKKIVGPSRLGSTWVTGIESRPLGAARNIAFGNRMLSFGGSKEAAPWNLAETGSLFLSVADRVTAKAVDISPSGTWRTELTPAECPDCFVDLETRGIRAFHVKFRPAVSKGCGDQVMESEDLISSYKGDKCMEIEEAQQFCRAHAECVQMASSKPNSECSGGHWYFYRRMIPTKKMGVTDGQTRMQCIQVASPVA
jgi:hypothetical protein